MTSFDMVEKETTAYQLDTFENLAVQDALTIVAVFAAQLAPGNCEEDVRRIAAVSENYPEFEEARENILKRINKFVNPMLAADNQLKAVEIAKDALTSEQRETAYEMAVEIALPDKVLTDEIKTVIKTLETQLSIESNFAQKTIEKFTG